MNFNAYAMSNVVILKGFFPRKDWGNRSTIERAFTVFIGNAADVFQIMPRIVKRARKKADKPWFWNWMIKVNCVFVFRGVDCKRNNFSYIKYLNTKYLYTMPPSNGCDVERG